MQRRTITTLLRRATKVAILAAVAAHAAGTALYNMPYNPATAAIKPELDATVGTYLPQNWRLFAPNPTSSDVAMLVGCIDAEQTQALTAAFADGDERGYEGPWTDITDPLWRRHQEARFSAYDRLSRPQANAARDFIGVPGSLQPWAKSCEHGDTRGCKVFEGVLKQHQRVAAETMRRIASSYCWATAPNSAAVAIRVRETSALPWSERFDSSAQRRVRDGDVGVFPIDPTVEPAPMYTATEV